MTAQCVKYASNPPPPPAPDEGEDAALENAAQQTCPAEPRCVLTPTAFFTPAATAAGASASLSLASAGSAGAQSAWQPSAAIPTLSIPASHPLHCPHAAYKLGIRWQRVLLLD